MEVENKDSRPGDPAAPPKALDQAEIERLTKLAIAEAAADFAEGEQLRRRAAAEPLPGPLAGAFAGDPPKVAGIQLRKLVASDFIMLKKLDSPLYRRSFELAEHQRKIQCGEVPADQPPPQTPFTEEELAEMVFQLAMPAAMARKVLAQGRQVFREAAMREVFDKVRITDMPDLVQAVIALYMEAFSTAVAYKEPDEEGGTKVDFRPPPARQETGSAGGSTISPVCAVTTGFRLSKC